MTAAAANLITRDDTMFGICEAIGEDLGFHPNFLRVTLAVLLLWNPTVVLIAYASAGVVVLASRLLFPARRRVAKAAPREAVPAQPAAAEPVIADAAPLALAA